MRIRNEESDLCGLNKQLNIGLDFLQGMAKKDDYFLEQELYYKSIRN